MKKLLASIGIAALLAVGLFWEKGTTPAYAACGTQYPVNSATWYSYTYDYWSQSNTWVKWYLIEYSDNVNYDTSGACVSFFVMLQVGDQNPNVGLNVRSTVNQGFSYPLDKFTVTCPPDNNGNGGCSFTTRTYISSGNYHINANTSRDPSVSNWCGTGSSTSDSYYYYGGFTSLCDHHSLWL